MYGFNIGVDMTYEQVTSMLFKGANVYASRRSRHIDILQTEDFSDSFIRRVEVHDRELVKVTQEADGYLDTVDRLPHTKEIAQPKIPIIPTENYDFASMYGLSVGKTANNETPAGISNIDTNKDTGEKSGLLYEDDDYPQDSPNLDTRGVTGTDTGLLYEEDEHPQAVMAGTPNIGVDRVRGVDTGLLYEEDEYPTVSASPVNIETKQSSEYPTEVENEYPQVSTTPVFVESKQRADIPTKVLSAPAQAHNIQPQNTPSPTQPHNAPAQTVPDISGMTLIGQAGAIAKWYGKSLMSEEELFCAFGKSVVMKLVGEGYLVRTRKGIILGS